jgi:hypothetical protein
VSRFVIQEAPTPLACGIKSGVQVSQDVHPGRGAQALNGLTGFFLCEKVRLIASRLRFQVKMATHELT